MATEVGTAYVAIIPSAKGFAKSLQKSIAQEFAGSDLDKLISHALGDRKPIKLPVTPEVDPTSVPDKLPVPKGKEPKLPVALDPLLREFQSQVSREVTALSREVNAKIPVTPETAQLRSELASEINKLERELKAEIPTEPGGQREYEAKLHALVQGVQRRVKASIQVEPEVDRNRFRTALMSGVSAALGGITSAASTVVGAVSAATSSLTGLVTGLLAVGAAATFIVPGVYLAGGAIGSLPAIIAGAVAAFGALSLGMMGIADHFKEVSGGGGGAGENLAAQARQVAQATRGVEAAQRSLARAQREVVLAQRAVTRAREDEVERLQDLDRSVRRARLDEEEATRNVVEAVQDLDRARRSGDPEEIRRAELAYKQALLGVEDAKDATEDLSKEQAKSAKVGVEGSEQVQEALRRQQDAIEGVTAANEQLLSAHEALQAAYEKPASGGGGVAQELMKLAPSAQAFVKAIKALKPAFEALRLNVQQQLFAGLDETVKGLATAWFPQLNKTLGDYASTFNRLAKQTANSLSQKSFIDNVAAGAESARKALKTVGDAVSGPLVDAFGRLARAAGPFVERLGDELATVILEFSQWIADLDNSGALDRFFMRASDILSDVFDMGRDIASIFGSVMTILFNGGDQAVQTSVWESLKLTLDKIAVWFKDPENQQKVRDFIDKVKAFLTQDLPASIAKAKDAIDTVDGWLDTIERWKQRIEGFRDAVVNAFGIVSGALRSVTSPVTAALQQFTRLQEGAAREAGRVAATMLGVPGRIMSALGNTGKLLYQAGRNVIQGLIDGIRARFSDLGNAIGSAAGLIRAYLPFSPAKMGPLSGAGNPYNSGQSIVRMLSSGITDTLGTAESAAADLAGTFALDGGPAGGMSVSSGVLPSPAPVMLGFGGDAPDSFMRWMKENVRIYYGGSAQAAIGTR